MPPKNLGKITKHINKKKGKNAVLHNESRDTRRLLRASKRDDKLYKIGVASKRTHRPYVNRVLYFQQAATSHPEPFTVEETKTLVESWLDRNASELTTLRTARRANRPASKREEDIAQVKAHDEVEYGSGYWMPNLQDRSNLLALSAWNGEWVGLGTIGFVRFHKDGAVVESSFPPKGES